MTNIQNLPALRAVCYARKMSVQKKYMKSEDFRRSVVMRKLFSILAVMAVVAFAAPAFAANPFADVPAGHWSYDAVAQLAARGVVSGYPDGEFKGAQVSTRYEMASVVARALANVDAEKASKQDLEMLKKLTMEFKDELDALGVKVNKIDKRVAVLEDRLGGWKLNGTLMFEAVFGGDEGRFMNAAQQGKSDNQFRKEQFYLFLSKQIDENTSFFAEYLNGADDTLGTQGGMNELAGDDLWREVYIDTKLPYDVKFRFGRFNVDFEDEYGLFNDDEPMFGHFYVDGFKAAKSWGALTATGIIGRNSTGSYNAAEEDELGFDTSNQHMDYIVNFHYEPSEQWFAGLLGYWRRGDSTDSALATEPNNDYSLDTYGVYGKFSFTPDIAVKGVYYTQNADSALPSAKQYGDSADAWKAVLEIGQDTLKFTSLWIEYNQQDNNFLGIHNERFGIGGSGCDFPVTGNKPVNGNTSKYFFVRAEQQWNDKWSTRLRYAHVDYDTTGYDDATEFEVAAIYQYTDAIAFELLYDKVDFGDTTAPDAWSGDDDVIIFRTTVNF